MTYNTGETNEELRALYNPEGSELRKIQERLLMMLEYLDSICRKIGVPYCLMYGNVLGAIRHQGFIPWDDDIDVMIPKEHYNRLCNYLRDNPHPQYVLQSVETDPRCLRLWNTLRDTKSRYIHQKKAPFDESFKYQGLQIDLFCFEPGVFKKLHYWSFLIYHNTVPKIAVKSYLMGRIVYCFLTKMLFPFFSLLSKFFGNKREYMRSYGNGPNVVYPEDVLFPFKEIIYEGKMFWGPAKPEDYLRLEFGNWKDLPPVEKRNQHNVIYEFFD